MNFKNFLIKNKKANFNYDISDKYTAGMVLKGTEIKSLKESKVNFSNSYCLIIDDQVYLKGMNISEYLYGNINEIKQIKKKVTEKKLSIVPIKLFINNRGYVKLEIGLGKGKKSFDKREDIKKRDIDRNLRESLKNI